jgi:hypothetical protein
MISQQGRASFVVLLVVVGVVIGAIWLLSRSDPAGPDSAGVAISPLAAGETSPRKAVARQEPPPPPPSPAELWRAIDAPADDGWTTEVLSSRAQSVLETLLSPVFGEEVPAAESFEEIVTGGCIASALRPEGGSTVREDGLLRIRRVSGETGRAEEKGPPGVLAAALSLRGAFRSGTEVRRKLKTFRIELLENGSRFRTRHIVSLVGRSPGGLLEINSTWEATWMRGEGDSILLEALSVIDHEEVELRSGDPLFTDCTGQVVAKAAALLPQLTRGFNDWLERSQDTRYFALLGTPGLALGDVDGDGREDLYLCQEDGLPNRLLLHHEDGRVTEVSGEWGVDWIEPSRGALLLDLDNDGDPDLAVATLGNLVVASNEGGRFEIRAVLPTGDDAMSLVSADVDLDGDLDLYVCVNYPDDSPDEARAQALAGGGSVGVYHDANFGGRNSLFLNEIKGGTWSLREATRETGLDTNNRRFSFAASFEDFDDDGDQDLYVANDFGRNSLYLNRLVETGTLSFEDIAGPAGAEDSASGMSVAWGDYDRDGLMDIYVSNMFSSAGGRITFQEQFKPEAKEEVRERIRRFARGNTLLRNGGDGTFSDVSEAAGVTMGRWAWSSSFLDLDNDGREDLVVANGYITTEDPGDL